MRTISEVKESIKEIRDELDNGKPKSDIVISILENQLKINTLIEDEMYRMNTNKIIRRIVAFIIGLFFGVGITQVLLWLLA